MVFTRFLALAFINLICSFVAADDEYFTVKRNNLKDFRDRFAVPAGERVPKDFCSRFNAGKYLRSKTDCRCPLANPTFGYYENAWLCFNNTKLKKQQACRAQIMSLQPTQEGDVLYTVFSYSRAPRAYNVNFTSASPACEVSSWTYQKCGGQWLPYNPSKSSPRLSLQYSSSDAWFQLKVALPTKGSKFLEGSLIKVAINCPRAWPREDCLLFKLRGFIKCSTTPPVMPTTSERTSSAAPTTPTSLSTLQMNSTIPASRTTVLPGNKDNTGVDESSLGVPAVVGAAIGGVLVIVVVILVALVIFRRRTKRRANNNSTKAKPSAGVCYKVADKDGRMSPEDGDYLYQEPSVTVTTEPPQDTGRVSSDRKNGIDSPGAAIYDLPVQVGSQSPSGRVPSEYEPLRFSGAGTEYEDMNGRQSVYQELQRPGKEEHEEPMYVVIN